MTGLRVNEALGLAEEEVDPQRSPADDQAKNRRSRLVPLSASTAERMGAYRAERNHILGHGRVAFFLLEAQSAAIFDRVSPLFENKVLT